MLSLASKRGGGCLILVSIPLNYSILFCSILGTISEVCYDEKCNNGIERVMGINHKFSKYSRETNCINKANKCFLNYCFSTTRISHSFWAQYYLVYQMRTVTQIHFQLNFKYTFLSSLPTFSCCHTLWIAILCCEGTIWLKFHFLFTDHNDSLSPLLPTLFWWWKS